MAAYWEGWRRRDPHKAVGGTSKMTKETVRKLRDDAQRGLNYNQLASKYGISNVAASRIVRRLTWQRV